MDPFGRGEPRSTGSSTARGRRRGRCPTRLPPRLSTMGVETSKQNRLNYVMLGSNAAWSTTLLVDRVILVFFSLHHNSNNKLY
jgi:hypothetical protein